MYLEFCAIKIFSHLLFFSYYIWKSSEIFDRIKKSIVNVKNAKTFNRHSKIILSYPA